MGGIGINVKAAWSGKTGEEEKDGRVNIFDDLGPGDHDGVYLSVVSTSGYLWHKNQKEDPQALYEMVGMRESVVSLTPEKCRMVIEVLQEALKTYEGRLAFEAEQDPTGAARERRRRNQP